VLGIWGGYPGTILQEGGQRPTSSNRKMNQHTTPREGFDLYLKRAHGREKKDGGGELVAQGITQNRAGASFHLWDLKTQETKYRRCRATARALLLSDADGEPLRRGPLADHGTWLLKANGLAR